MPEVDAIAWLWAWFQESGPDLESLGTSITFGQSADDRLKPSAWVSAVRSGRMANLQVWSSGEAEFDAGAYDLIDVQTHYEIRDEVDLKEAVAAILLYLRVQ
jgi:hypothetical protein